MAVFLVTLFLSGALILLSVVFFLKYAPTRYSSPYSPTAKGSESHTSPVQVLVLGDIGRSPRMCNHALSIANRGQRVALIGYHESPVPPAVSEHENIRIVALPRPPKKPGRLPFLFFAPYKVLSQVYHLLWTLNYNTRAARWLIVQNPPTIPTFAIATLSCFLRNTGLVIDWHNYGWTILAGTRGASHPLVIVARWFEQFFGRFGRINLTVTSAMADELSKPPYRISRRSIVILHDRPPDIFQPVQTHDERERTLARVLPDPHKDLASSIVAGTTRLLISSTSWTHDEDFGILLRALVRYAKARITSSDTLPPILAIITGKGPQKAHYLNEIASLTKQGLPIDVRVATVFLPYADYAQLLGCADLGVCLHMSSSGVDLPMKVVDMFGAGLPVAAYSAYRSFSELVKEGQNGRGFESAEELAQILAELFDTRGAHELTALRKGACAEGKRRWEDEWTESGLPDVLGLKRTIMNRR